MFVRPMPGRRAATGGIRFAFQSPRGRIPPATGRMPRGEERRTVMSDELNVHKISDKHKRRADHIEERLEEHGMGEGQAEKEAMRQAVAELGPSAGGPNAAGDSPSHANHERDHRLGSAKQAHSG